MAGKKYQGMTFEEMDALVKKNEGLTEAEREMLGKLTQQDYNDYVSEKNWATARPGHFYAGSGGLNEYTGWDGGSVTGADISAATSDAHRYGYDVWLDPRNGTRDMIAGLLQDVNIKANEDAVNGIGDYDTNRQNYLNQIGWTNYQDLFKRLQDTGSLGLTDLEGNDLTALALAERDKMLPGTPYELTPEMMQQMQNEYAAIVAQQNNVNTYLSPLMNGQGGGGQSGAWNYDKDTDPVWQAYLKQYGRAADKGMNDILAQLSARTGGMASTYAGQVAQQTHSDILQGATDMIPRLAEQDYDRWLTDKQMAIDAEQQQYERQMAAEQMQYERMMAQQQLAADQQAQNASLLLSLMESYGYMPSAEELAAAGLSQGMADAMNAGYQNQLALEWAKTNKTTGGKAATENLDYISYLNEYGAKDYNTAFLALLSQGVDEDKANDAASAYISLLESQAPVVENAASVFETDRNFAELQDKTVNEYAMAAENWTEVAQIAKLMQQEGATKAQILEMLREALSTGALNENDFTMLYGMYK